MAILVASRLSLDKRRKCLMGLSEISQNKPEAVVNFQQLADYAGVTLDQAKYAFIWLTENTFAKGNWIRDGTDANIQITVKGSDEVDRLRLPAWKRFATDESVQYTALVGIIAGIVSGVIVGLILKAI
jgi:hypothetical protein